MGYKLIFRIKRNTDGTISSYKARLVVKGFIQRSELDFHETFSPILEPVMIRDSISILKTANKQHKKKKKEITLAKLEQKIPRIKLLQKSFLSNVFFCCLCTKRNKNLMKATPFFLQILSLF